VTNAQYCKFLNAKAASSDPYRLWHSDMGSDANGGIERSGGGPYQYAVKPGQDNQPLVDVTWYNAVRFVNWLTNGQGNGGTENGTYEITSIGPDWTAAVPDASQRAKWAGGAKTYWLLPSEDEWYKAAYYKGGGAHAGYWKYPTQHNTPPISTAPPGGSNTANFCDSTTGYAVTGSTNYNSRWNYLTDVGSYPYSVGVYGTLDQGGNVWQWNDTLIDVRRGLRGGAWVTARSTLGSAFRYGSYPTHRSISIGLRVARIGGLPVAAGQSPIGE
jgi:formylglycine-generating enzyme required for sulfatase activity